MSVFVSNDWLNLNFINFIRILIFVYSRFLFDEKVIFFLMSFLTVIRLLN